MQRALATFRNGHLEWSSPVDWPDGTPVEVIPLRQRIGMDESEWPATADAIRCLLKRMDETALEDDEAIEFAGDWPAWEARQREAVRTSWNDLEQMF